MDKKKAKRLDFALDMTNAAIMGGYGLITADKWGAVVSGAIDIPGAAALVMWTMLLIGFWGIVGYLKGFTVDD